MFDPVDGEVFWLNVTNISLGLVTLICLLAVGVAVVREVASRRARAVAPVLLDDHGFAFSGLGITMADGGENVAERAELDTTVIDNTAIDQPNIIRSNN